MNPSHRRFLLRLAPLLISLTILAYAFRGIPKENWKSSIESLTFSLVAVYILFSLIGTGFRMWRFSVLLSHRIPVFDLLLITLVQNFSVDLLPARTAALGFFTYFTRRRGIDWEEGVSGFISSIVYDVLAVALLLSPAVLIWKGEIASPLPILAGLILLAGGAFLFLRAVPWFLGLLSQLKPAQRHRLQSTLTKAAVYFQVHQSPKEQTLLLGISFLIKLCKYLSIYVFFVGLLHIRPGFSSFFLFNFAVAAAEVSAYLPIQGLAGFGTWEAAFAIAVNWVGVPVADPFLVAFIIHLITQAWEYSIGIAAFLILSFRKRRAQQPGSF